MLNELLGCPFCGTKPVKERKGLDERFAYADEVCYRCPKCGCSRCAMGDTSKPGYADNSTVEERALEAWQTRHPNVEVTGSAPTDLQEGEGV